MIELLSDENCVPQLRSDLETMQRDELELVAYTLAARLDAKKILIQALESIIQVLHDHISKAEHHWPASRYSAD
jgi:hypothetical protein